MSQTAIAFVIMYLGFSFATAASACDLDAMATPDKAFDVNIRVLNHPCGDYYTGESLALNVKVAPRGKAEISPAVEVAAVTLQRDDGLAAFSEPGVRKMPDGSFFADNLEFAAPGTWVVELKLSRDGRKDDALRTTFTVALNPEQAALAVANQAHVPDFALKDPNGRLVKRSDLAGKVWVAAFFFASCPEICPMMSQKMAGLQRLFKGAPDFRLVSVTTDPTNDKPEILKEFAARYKADTNRWFFLTGDKSAVVALSDGGLKLDVKADTPMHSTRIAIVDRDGSINGAYDSTKVEELEQLKIVVKSLLAKGPSVGLAPKAKKKS